MGALPHSRRRDYEENYPREPRRLEKPYPDTNSTDGYYHDTEAGSRDGYYRDYGHERSSRYDGRDDYSGSGYNHRSRNYHHNRDDSREKDNEYGRRSYDSDYDRGSVRDGSRKSRDSQDREWDSRDREWDKRCFSRERDVSPRKRYEKSRSRSGGRDGFSRSRSPRGRSHGRDYREESYEGDHWHESERQREYEDRHDQDHFSAVYIFSHPWFIYDFVGETFKNPFLYFAWFLLDPIRHCCCERSLDEINRRRSIPDSGNILFFFRICISSGLNNFSCMP